ncbi:MAG: Ig-like domain-containing protein [Xenococcus sp. MO_188.B8]|nr:Ig-like domain-containing protein [Xenococcus sp. MO_188.B8]
MNRKGLLIVLTSLLNLVVGCGESDTQPPRVVSTIPENESVNVDPSLTEISVKFNEEMMDGNWSWAYSDRSEFPQMTGQAYYTENKTRNVLPVKLESNKNYVIWINSPKHKNFKDKNGNSAYPFKFTFKTK